MKTVFCFGASLTSGTVSFNYLELLARPTGAGRLPRSSTTASTATSRGTACSGSTRSIAEEPDFVAI